MKFLFVGAESVVHRRDTMHLCRGQARMPYAEVEHIPGWVKGRDRLL